MVGAGLAGLTAARDLEAVGAIVTVVEARDRVGGRVLNHHLASGGDTLEMMQAVLDTNFWLATHVVVVTIGYSATFLAGVLALMTSTLGTRAISVMGAKSF